MTTILPIQGTFDKAIPDSPMKQEGFEHRQIHMGLSIPAHNLWVSGGLSFGDSGSLRSGVFAGIVISPKGESFHEFFHILIYNNCTLP